MDEGFTNPTHDRSGNRKASITKQFKAYNDIDPAVEWQPALPVFCLRTFIQRHIQLPQFSNRRANIRCTFLCNEIMQKQLHGR